MIKKIQKYLLLHYPTIWNIKLIPMVLILLGVHLVFFTIGYFATNVTFGQTYYYNSPWGEFGILYFVSVLISILLLIGWLVFYNRNNGFKTFYPKKTNQLFIEWIMIFVISIGISFVPFSLSKGYVSRWKSVVSLKEAQRAQDLLDKIKVLIPESKGSYNYDKDYNEPIPVPEGMNLDTHNLNLDDYSVQYSGSGNLIIRGYTGASLLFYRNYHYYDYYNYNNGELQYKSYMDSSNWNKVRGSEQVKKWLREGDKEKIVALMKDFEHLQHKHNMPVNITPENWFKRVYNPPFFPVNKSTMISNYQPSNFNEYYNSYGNRVESVSESDIAIAADSIAYTLPILESDSDYIPAGSLPYLQYEELASGYQQIIYCYVDQSDIEWFVLICACISLLMAAFVFSFRVTNGKSWLIALVSTGVLIFAVILFAVALGQSLGWRHDEIIIMIVTLFWISLFVILLSKILLKINNKAHKGRSNIYLNVMLWLLLCLIPLAYLTVVAHSKLSGLDYLETEESDVMCMFWLNIIISIPVMWVISALIRRWKSIADE